MNAGLTEEGGKVAVSLIDSLKSQPVTLALVVFNAVFLGLVYLNAQENKHSNERMFSVMMDQLKYNSEMLYRCTPGNG